MNIIYILLLLFLLLIIKKTNIYSKKKYAKRIITFKEKLMSKDHFNKKIFERFSNELISDPMNNIKINNWDDNDKLLEKANIHKTRLMKHGKSKLNNIIYYKNNQNKIYTISEEGEKIYI